MNEHGDQLRDAFETHEHLAPDAAAVWARVEELSRTYRRRRRGAQAAGGAVLGVGLIAGGLAVPRVLPGNSQAQAVTVQAAAGGAAATLPPQTPTQLEADYAAYFAAGYGYDDAIRLAKIWKVKSDPGTVKAEAGRRLLAGETLPIKPGPERPVSDKPTKTDKDVSAFFAAGYTYDDAATLSKLWKTADTYHAKIKGGAKLLAGETLPIKP